MGPSQHGGREFCPEFFHRNRNVHFLQFFHNAGVANISLIQRPSQQIRQTFRAGGHIISQNVYLGAVPLGGQLNSRHHFQAVFLGCLLRLVNAVGIVMVGDGNGLIPCLRRHTNHDCRRVGPVRCRGVNMHINSAHAETSLIRHIFSPPFYHVSTEKTI